MTTAPALITRDGLQQEIRNILSHDGISNHNARVLAERLMQGYLNLAQRVELHGPSGEWSALYVDGKLAQVGDTYVCEESLHTLLGITEVEGSDFMRGQNGRSGVAQTPQEVTAYSEEREAREHDAAQLRAQAQELLARASALECGEEVPAS